MEESVSDSEVDFHSKVDEDLPKRGSKRWAYSVRRVSIGWSPVYGTNSLFNGGDTIVQPERAVESLRSPSVQTYSNLKRRLLKFKSNPEWILQFLQSDGLEILFESLEQICQQKSSNFLDSVLQIGCIECVKTVMDSSLGLDYIVENPEFTRKFASALDTDNAAVKKQIFELLSALCVYSKEGYKRALDALEQYKTNKKLRFRFSVVLDEFRNNENLKYKITLLEFINCVIIYTEKIEDRVRIRNELFGLRLQEVLNQLRRLEDTDQDVTVQLDQFELNKTIDDEQLPGIKGVDLNSPLEVFYAINKQVADTPQEIHFLTLLQHLLKIDQNDANSDLIWQTVEKLACRATLVESAEDSQKLILSSQRKRERSTDGKCTCACHDCDKQRVTSPRRTNSTSVASPTTKVAPPPPVPAPPPPPPPMGGPPPPPPPGIPGAPPPPGFAGLKPAPAKLPQQNVPKAKNKMRTLQWQKIPVDKIVTGKPNIWTMAGKRFNGYVSKMDYDAIEELFSVSKPPSSSTSGSKGGSNQNTLDKKRKESTEINLLDGKRSLNVNIFLKQFRMTNEEIVNQLRAGDSQKLGLEKLKGLMKILPDQDELEMFKSFQGEKDKLGSAEKFFVCLFTLPNYAIRIDGLLIKEEFRTAMEWIRPSIDSVIEAAKDIKENKELHELLYLVLIAGNYLNSGNYAGDAAGFKLSSLIKLTEIRANKPRMNLLHYVVMQAAEKNPRLLQFPEDMKFLKDASQVSMENLVNDIANLNKKYTRISEHIGTVGKDFQNQMSTFLKGAKEELSELEEDLKDIDSLRLELSDFFCEDPQTFKMEEAFRTLQGFCERFSKAITENDTRQKQEEKAEAKRKQRELEAKKNAVEEIKSPEGQTMDRGMKEEGSIVDLLLADVRSGFANRKFGESNFTVQKVQKVSLDANENIKNGSGKAGDDQFVRMGYGRRSMRRRKFESDMANGIDTADSESTCSSIETCSSLEDSVEYANQARTRKSYAIYSEDKLFDILMTPGENQDTNNNTEGKFERFGSLRRRRQERREKRSVLDVYDGRERAPSPAVEDVKTNVSEIRRSRTPSTNERPLSGNFEEEKTPLSSIRRSRSMHDRPLSASAKSDNETDSITKVKQRHSEQRNDSPQLNENKTLSDSSKSVQNEESTDTRSSSKWRSNINSADVQKILQTIDEKSRLETPTRELLQNEQNNSAQESLEKSRDRLARKFSRNSVDPSELQKMLENVDISQQSATEEDKTDDEHQVSVSVKTKLNRRWHSDLGKNEIDKVLKDIEDSETQNKPDAEEALKKRREKRKQRETLSIDDVHAALKEIRTTQDPDSTQDAVVAHTVTTTAVTNVPKSPAVPPRRSRSNSEGNEESNTPEKEAKPKKDRDTANMSKAAKLAAKRRFRHERFGDKEKAILNSSDGRWKSDVHRQEVDQALKDMAKGGMSRSKSYDESVARKALGESGEFSLAGNNDASDKKSFRSSLGRLGSGDSRRNGIYMPSSDSECEVPSEGVSSPRRSSSTKSDSPKSSSRLSIKSTSTSTETLRCETPYSDGEVSPEQKRRNSAGKKQEQLGTVEITDDINGDYDNAPTAPPRIKRSNSLLEKSELHLPTGKDHVGESDESPMALMARWRTKRSKGHRQSFYDNVSDQENPASPRNKNDTFSYDSHIGSPRLNTHSGLTIIHKSESSGDSYSAIRNDIGSRCSYASSSDSARDEGFETMSGTVSQRTSLSSTLESELTPSFTRKTDGLKITHPDKTTFADDIIPNKQERVVSHAQKQSEIDARKQRTESWTEAVVATTNLNKDTSLDSSMEYAATSPDSGHCTSKEDVWSENMDLESTIRSKSPSSDEHIIKAPLAKPENTKTIAGKKKSVPSYMRGTASSSTRTTRVSTGGPDSTQRRSLAPNTATGRPQSRNSSRISTNLNKSMTESNTSIVSSVSAASETSTTSHNKTNIKRRTSANYGKTPNSRSTTPNPASRPTTPHVTNSRPPSRTARESAKASPSTPATKTSSNSPITTTPLASRGFTRTQSLRLPSTTAKETVERLAKNTSTGSKSKPSFMSPTAASKAKDDQPPPTPPPRTTSTNTTPKSATKTPSISVTPPPKAGSESRKSTASPSPLTRSASMRLPSKSSSRLMGRDSPMSEKEKDSKVKSFMNKLGGNKVKPESPNKKLATVAEQASSQECLDSADGKDKSSSFIKKIVNKTKDIKSPGKKSSETTAKTDTDKRKVKK